MKNRRPYDWRWVRDPHPVFLLLAALLAVLVAVTGMIVMVQISGKIHAPIVWRYGVIP